MIEKMKNNEKDILEESIDPTKIVTAPTEQAEPKVTEEDDDSDMPQPQTKAYKKYLKCTDMFMSLFMECVSNLPYSSVLKNNDGAAIKLTDLVHFVEQNREHISVDDMNVIISYIANLGFKIARPLMEVVDNKAEQSKLWMLIKD